MISKDANPNLATNNRSDPHNGYTPLRCEVEKNHRDGIKLIIQAGADTRLDDNLNSKVSKEKMSGLISNTPQTIFHQSNATPSNPTPNNMEQNKTENEQDHQKCGCTIC